MSPERARSYIKTIAVLYSAKVKINTLNASAVEGLMHSKAVMASDYPEDVLSLFRFGMEHYNQEMKKP